MVQKLLTAVKFDGVKCDVFVDHVLLVLVHRADDWH